MAESPEPPVLIGWRRPNVGYAPWQKIAGWKPTTVKGEAYQQCMDDLKKETDWQGWQYSVQAEGETPRGGLYS